MAKTTTNTEVIPYAGTKFADLTAEQKEERLAFYAERDAKAGLARLLVRTGAKATLTDVEYDGRAYKSVRVRVVEAKKDGRWFTASALVPADQKGLIEFYSNLNKGQALELTYIVAKSDVDKTEDAKYISIFNARVVNFKKNEAAKEA